MGAHRVLCGSRILCTGIQCVVEVQSQAKPKRWRCVSERRERVIGWRLRVPSLTLNPFPAPPTLGSPRASEYRTLCVQ